VLASRMPAALTAAQHGPSKLEPYSGGKPFWRSRFQVLCGMWRSRLQALCGI
jgi:hypothetical protein